MNKPSFSLPQLGKFGKAPQTLIPQNDSNTLMKKFRRNMDVIASGIVLPRLPGQDATNKPKQLSEIYKRVERDEKEASDTSGELYVGPDGVLMKADMSVVNPKVGPDKLTSTSNKLLSKLMEDLDWINQEDAVDVDEELPKVVTFDEREQRDFTRIKRLQPMSSVDIICFKDEEQFYRLKWDGWKFPLTLNFNLSVHVDVYVSFTNRKPGPNSFAYKFLRQSVIHMTDPTAAEKKLSDTLNICICPKSNFATSLSVKFDSKDYSKIKPRIKDMKDFHIDYKQLNSFTTQFLDNQKLLEQHLKKRRMLRRREEQSKENSMIFSSASSPLFPQQSTTKVPASVIHSNSAIAEHFMEYKEQTQWIFQTIQRQKQHAAHYRAQTLRESRIQTIMHKVDQRDAEREHRHHIISSVLEHMMGQTQIRAFMTVMFTYKVLQAMQDGIKDPEAQKLRRAEYERKPAIQRISAYMKYIVEMQKVANKCSRFLLIARKVCSRFRRSRLHKKESLQSWKSLYFQNLDVLAQLGKKKKIPQLSSLVYNRTVNDAGTCDSLLRFLYDYLHLEHLEANLSEKSQGLLDFEAEHRKFGSNRYMRLLEQLRGIKKKHSSQKRASETPVAMPKTLMTSEESPLVPRQADGTLTRFSPDIEALDFRYFICCLAEVETAVPLKVLLDTK